MFLKTKNTKFIKSIFNYQDSKSKIKQFCFLGRSNVGKSSLINFLFNQKKLAYTSKKPGKTICLNLFSFEIENKLYQFLDSPGYGYGINSKQELNSFQNLMQNYLKKASNLKLLILLLDIRRTNSQNDKIMLEFLKFLKVPFVIFFTKIDKLSNPKINKNLAIIKKYLNLDSKIEYILTSSFKKINFEGCWEIILKHLKS